MGRGDKMGRRRGRGKEEEGGGRGRRRRGSYHVVGS